MNNYELVYEIIQESYDNGKITLEEAELLNDYAYDRYITEANRLTKEYNKKQNEYKNTVRRADKDTEKQKHKIEKYKRVIKNHPAATGSIDHNTILRAAENADKKIDENEKDKKRAKYMSKSKGLNRDILYKDKETSLSIGRKTAKEIAKHNDNGYKEYLSWKAQMRDAKKEGNLAKIKKLKETEPKLKQRGLYDKLDTDDIAKYKNKSDVKSKAKELGSKLKEKQTEFKDQNGIRRSYTRNDFIMRDEKKHKNNTLLFQDDLKSIDKDISTDKAYGMYKPTSGTDRINFNRNSIQKDKELREKFRKDRKEFIRRLDNRIKASNSREENMGHYRNLQIKKFENEWFQKNC